MSQSESRKTFIPTDHERRVLLELIQSPQESLESIAHELKITLAALTIYLATDDAAVLFAQADLANARRARTAAAAQLEQCVGALSLMISGWVSDVTHNLRRETPKSRREQDREQESARRAATLLYRIANFTPRTIMAASHSPSHGGGREGAGGRVHSAAVNATNALPSQALPNTTPTRKRGAADATIAPPSAAEQSGSDLNTTPATSTIPERERMGSSALTSAIRHPTSDIVSAAVVANPEPEVALRPDDCPLNTPSSNRRVLSTIPP